MRQKIKNKVTPEGVVIKKNLVILLFFTDKAGADHDKMGFLLGKGSRHRLFTLISIPVDLSLNLFSLYLNESIT